jgi:hypothetical protein
MLCFSRAHAAGPLKYLEPLLPLSLQAQVPPVRTGAVVRAAESPRMADIEIIAIRQSWRHGQIYSLL